MENPPAGDMELSYGDSVFYVKQEGQNSVIIPVGNFQGKFTAFPEGIELNELTGAIDVNKSETGLRYRITYTPDDHSDTLSTVILLSGISYLDKIYNLEKNENVALPVYNGRTENAVPGKDGSSVFDDGGGCNGEGVAVDYNTGSIDLAQTVRNGLFGDEPKNGAQKEVEMLYRISDKSGKALNKLKVKLYYFDTPDDITEDLVQEMTERRDMFIGLNPQPPFIEFYNPSRNVLVNAGNSRLGTAKPRPPCIFLVGRASK
jgi:hypothetical protein